MQTDTEINTDGEKAEENDKHADTERGNQHTRELISARIRNTSTTTKT